MPANRYGNMLVFSCAYISKMINSKTYAVVDASSSTVGGAGQAAKVLRSEDGGLGESASPLLLIPPGESAVEAALVAEDLLEGPDVVSVP